MSSFRYLFVLLIIGGASVNGATVSLSFNDSGPRPVLVDNRIPTGKPAGRFDVAVLIGNGRYSEQGMPAVDFAHNDVQVMKRYLVRTMGFRPDNVFTYQDLSFGQMRRLFGTPRRPGGKLKRLIMQARAGCSSTTLATARRTRSMAMLT